MYQALTKKNQEWDECKAEQSFLMELLHQRLGPHAMLGDLVELGAEDTPQYDPYADDSQNAETFHMLDEEPEVTPKWGDQYMNAEILLPKGDKMARDKMVHHKQDANGNPIGRSNQNSILVTFLHEVKFPGEEITKLAANMIAELMYV